MSNDSENKQLDGLVRLCKKNYKLCKAMLDYFSNNSVDVEKNFKRIELCLDSLKDEIYKLDKLKAAEPHVYTDEELAKLKKTMSWKELNRQTKIPVSTLQYRCRRYKHETEEGLNNA